MKKIKFIKTTEAKDQLNAELIDKTNILLGISYHQLYKIEPAFRISKHDLKTRPIFHFKKDSIKVHILICFMVLAVSKYVELKTNQSIQAFLSDCKKITDAKLLNKLNNKFIVLRVPLSVEVSTLLQKLNLLSH